MNKTRGIKIYNHKNKLQSCSMPHTKPKLEKIWCDASKCYIYPLINIHPGHQKVTDIYISSQVPLTYNTPINRSKVSEMISLKETLFEALKDNEENFIIDGRLITKEYTQNILKESLTTIYNKFHDV